MHPKIERWLEVLDEHGYLIPPAAPPAACVRCLGFRAEPQRAYDTCYACGWRHGAALHRLFAGTYAADGSRSYELMKSVKFDSAPPDERAARAEAAAAVLWATIGRHAPRFLEDVDDHVTVTVPSGHGFIASCRLAAERAGWSALRASDVLHAQERPQQTHLNETERRAAAAGKHSVTERLDGRHILLLDDMYTSGYTMHDAARAARDAGAASIAGAVFARRIYPDMLAAYREEQ